MLHIRQETISTDTEEVFTPADHRIERASMIASAWETYNLTAVVGSKECDAGKQTITNVNAMTEENCLVPFNAELTIDIEYTGSPINETN